MKTFFTFLNIVTTFPLPKVAPRGLSDRIFKQFKPYYKRLRNEPNFRKKNQRYFWAHTITMGTIGTSISLFASERALLIFTIIMTFVGIKSFLTGSRAIPNNLFK